MTKTTTAIAALAALGVAATVSTVSANQPGRGPRPGGLPEQRRHPGKWWQNPDAVEALALDDRQKSELDRLHRESRERSIDLHASIEKKELLLEDALESDPFDEARARAAAEEVATGRAELGKLDMELRIGVRKILTTTQFQKLRSLLPPPPPPGPPGPPPAPPAPLGSLPPVPPDAPMPPEAPLPPA